MSELFGTSTDNIGLHLKNIFLDNELSEEATTEDYLVVRIEGSRKVIEYVHHECAFSSFYKYKQD